MVAMACLPIFFSGYSILRWEGVLFLAYYLAYFSHLVLAAMGHGAAPGLDGFVISIMLPLTLMAVLIFYRRSPTALT